MVGHTGKYEPAIKGCEATGESAVHLESQPAFSVGAREDEVRG